METLNQLILYVEDIEKSRLFYQALLEIKPLAIHPNYVAFMLPSGLLFSLWSSSAVNYVSGGTGHRFELSFMVKTEQEIHDIKKRWQSLNITIEQDIAKATFGLTFVALDPDGHRMRVCLID